MKEYLEWERYHSKLLEPWRFMSLLTEISLGSFLKMFPKKYRHMDRWVWGDRAGGQQ